VRIGLSRRVGYRRGGKLKNLLVSGDIPELNQQGNVPRFL
jgi:hypothetical protein